MPRYQVMITEKVSYMVEVEADNMWEAKEIALDAIVQAPSASDYYADSDGFKVSLIRAITE